MQEKYYDRIENAPDIKKLSNLIEYYLEWKTANSDHPRNHNVFHPSAFGGCLRKMQYERYLQNNVKGLFIEDVPKSSKTTRIFDNGHTMHARWAEYWEGLGVLRGVWKCKNILCRMFDDNGQYKHDEKSLHNFSEPRAYGKKNILGVFKPEKCVCGCKKFNYSEIDVIDKSINMEGHADLILDFSSFKKNKNNLNNFKFAESLEDLPDHPIVADMKTVNNRGFLSLKEGPDFKYIVQLTIYANILNLPYGWLIYENKDTQEVNSFKVMKNADTLWPVIKQQAQKMNTMFKYEKSGNVVHLLPPPKPRTKDNYDCDYCDFKKTCHSSIIWKDPELHKKRRQFYGLTLNEN